MNAVEIEEAVSELSEQPFDPVEFPYSFLEAFGNKSTTIKKLRSGASNGSDIENGVLQRNNIHIAVCDKDKVSETLFKLKESPKTSKNKAQYVLATDGEYFEAEDLISNETIACKYADFADHFGFFLSLAGISTVKQIRESSFDIRATSRLNKLYVELLRNNPDWGTEERRHDMNHFMARLIFCFFAEDTDIFNGDNLFTGTVDQMSERDASNTHEIIGEIFRAMNVKKENHKTENIKSWASKFPYVNGGLFSGSSDCPKFSRIARSYLLHVGNLDWKMINPDIFGSMIQAVADDEERGSLGMHYTSVPNILKVLNPLFLDDLREQLEEAGDNARKLLNLRKRMARIRVFDPACGSGNFLVIAYKQMREIEAEINKRRGEENLTTEIPLTNFRGIELKDFSAEVARLALIIAEYQCDVLHRGQRLALAEFLPLNSENWITRGNALEIDWLSVCPPTGSGVKFHGDDLFSTPLDQAQIDFDNEGGETYICGNPPYLGARDQAAEQKENMKKLFADQVNNWKSLDYVAGWFLKAASFGEMTESAAAFVATNSICQGVQAGLLWPIVFQKGHQIFFAYPSFKWSNLASHNAGVTVVVVGLGKPPFRRKRLFQCDNHGQVMVKLCDNINPYLAVADNVVVEKTSKPISGQAEMTFGNTPIDGGNLLLTRGERDALGLEAGYLDKFVRPIRGAAEFIRGKERFCVWVEDDEIDEASKIPQLQERFKAVRSLRLKGGATAQSICGRPHQFQRMITAVQSSIIIPITTSENREYLPVGILNADTIILNTANAIYDAPIWNLAIIASKLMHSWIATVCIRMRTDYRFTPTLGWNTFPVPQLTEKNKIDLSKCAEEILIARERHFPATIADLYDPKNMDEKYPDLRRAHDRNDEVLERIYIGRRFKNDTERLEKLFELYTEMTSKQNTLSTSKRKTL